LDGEVVEEVRRDREKMKYSPIQKLHIIIL